MIGCSESECCWDFESHLQKEQRTIQPPDSLTMPQHRLDVFGREVLILREQNRWSANYICTEGKRRSATDIVIPASVAKADLAEYLADLFYESATEKHPTVLLLE